MAAFTHGMNPEEVDALGRKLQTTAEEMKTMISQLTGQIGSTTWEGKDAATFKNDWWPQHRGELQRVADALHGFGQSALNNASAQRAASDS